ncbi:MAG: hypothetical protein Q8O56_07060 [Solirubrobacteraceae bacterium]|nr:hypothetical protein [Solirubrobacteraceae bacterium]
MGAAAAVLAFGTASVAVALPESYRLFFASTITLVLITAAISWPRTIAVITLGFLCFLALIRRMLIESAGWAEFDPLLLVGPLVATALLARTYLVAGRRPDEDRLVRVVIALLALMALQVFNPSGSGIVPALGGLLFLAVPLVWFLVGRELTDRTHVRVVAYGLLGVSVIAALYGLAQTEIGFPSWDKDWIAISNIASLYIAENEVRGFGMLTNSAEYKQILAMGTVAALAFGAHGKPVALLTLPLLFTALVLSGARSGIALSLLGIILITAIRIRNRRLAVAVAILGIGLSLVALSTLSDTLASVAGGSTNAGVARQAAGYSDPFNPDKSTLPAHISLIYNGFVEGVSHPLGRGTANGNLASTRLSSAGNTSSEFDVTDALLALGVIGGVLYLYVVIVVLSRVIKEYRRSRDVLVLVAFGCLVVSLSGWLKGAHYAGASILWFLAGWATARQHVTQRAAPDPHMTRPQLGGAPR